MDLMRKVSLREMARRARERNASVAQHARVPVVREQHKFKKPNRKRKVRKSRHHLRNKVNGGRDCDANMLILSVEKHREWHILFKNSDPEYIIRVLQRMIRMKGYNYEECGR